MTAILAALAVYCLVAPPPTARLARLATPGVPRRRGRGVATRAAAVTALLLGAGLFGAVPLGWFLVAAVAVGTVAQVLRSRRRRLLAAAGAADSAAAARALASLLRSGQIPSRALGEAALDCQLLAPAAAALRLGGDPEAGLRDAARRPGCAGLERVAAAWRLSERSGAPIADLLTQVSENLRRERQLVSLIDAELATARTSGHIMAALPFLAVGLGFAAGVNPLDFLFRQPLGELLVLIGVVLTGAGVLWIDRLAASRRGAS